MRTTSARAILLALLPTLSGIASCAPTGTYKVNTFQFVPSGPPRNESGPVPNVWIDTNTKLSGLSGGTLASSLPCAVAIDYTDNSFSFKTGVFTAVKVTYDDGTVDPPVGAINLPLRIDAREHESVNSVAGGRIVKSQNWIISGKIPNVITRAEPFRLRIEGYFLKDDGTKLPFGIDQHFDIKTENTTKGAGEVLQDK